MIKKIIAIGVLSLVSFNTLATTAVFRVINNSSETIVKIVVSPIYRSQYGASDLLGNRLIRPGNSEIVDPGEFSDANNECVLDVLAIGENGGKWSKQIDVCETTTWTLTGGVSKKIR